MSIVHLDGQMNDKMAVTPLAAIHLRFPALATKPIPPHEHDEADHDASHEEEIPYEQAKAEYDRKMAALVEFFKEAREYQRSHAKVDLRLEAMIPVLEKKTPVFVTAVREREIREAIEFADRFGIKIIL